MPAKKQDKVLLTCPHCGHQQTESRDGLFHHLQEMRTTPARPGNSASAAARRRHAAPKQKHITCFECGAELVIPASAESTMCKRCSQYVDLHDYRITTAIAKNFKTKGAFIVELKGYVFNTESIVGDAVIRGKFHGKLAALGSLTIYSTADIKGSLTAAHLIIPAENHFRWPDPIKVGSAEIAGELAANLRAQDTVTLKSTARFFGNVDAKRPGC